MKRTSILILMMILVLIMNNVSAQPLKIEDTLFWNVEMNSMANPRSNRDWIFFRPEFNADPMLLLSSYKKAFNLGADDEMRFVKISEDQYGYHHYTFDQYYKGVRIYDGEFLVHVAPDGKLFCANGKMKRGLSLDTKPVITEAAAVTIAMTQINGVKGLWNYAAEEQKLRAKRNDPSATWFPKGELMLRAKEGTDHFHDGTMVLAWKYDLHVRNGVAKRVFVNATTGAILNEIDISDLCNPGTVNTGDLSDGWYGTKNINTDKGLGLYYLIDDCDPNILIHTYSYDYFAGEESEIADANNVWDDHGDPAEISGATTHWGVKASRDYYSFFHNRHSWDNDFGDLISYVNTQMDVNEDEADATNACWGCNGDVMTFGSGEDYYSDDNWNSIDVIGHEMTHGVDQSSHDLDGDGEAGALGESYSDIFGELIEGYVFNEMDWINGTPVGSNRNLKNPNSKNSPDTYGGDFWNGQEKYNMANVQNHWFYILYVGDTGANDFGINYSVEGIGTAAGDIAYLALTEYVTSAATFEDSRSATLQAAIEIFGSCSNEAIQTGKAWDAVAVGELTEDYFESVCGNILFGSWQAIGELQSGGGTCTTTATPTISSVTFSAGYSVTLSEGFSASYSGNNTFTAYLEPCAYTIYGKSSNETSENVAYEEEEQPTAQESFSLFPNPAADVAIVKFNLTEEKNVTVMVSDLNSRIVSRPITNAKMDMGEHQIRIDVSQLNPGMYEVQLFSGAEIKSQKLVILR
ncbi:MAG: M4 family metallopeptidase [Chitinophagaceae bacterium]|nr:M4 family metallopeptidase [Chitinophagaceae bacterium]